MNFRSSEHRSVFPTLPICFWELIWFHSYLCVHKKYICGYCIFLCVILWRNCMQVWKQTTSPPSTSWPIKKSETLSKSLPVNLGGNGDGGERWEKGKRREERRCMWKERLWENVSLLHLLWEINLKLHSSLPLYLHPPPLLHYNGVPWCLNPFVEWHAHTSFT